LDIYALAEIAEAAQVKIQTRCPLIDPVVEQAIRVAKEYSSV
tara:strand:- start:341 stop:466 length:126 start_codon:yes stop_codon:yes gene_type:complete